MSSVGQIATYSRENKNINNNNNTDIILNINLKRLAESKLPQKRGWLVEFDKIFAIISIPFGSLARPSYK